MVFVVESQLFGGAIAKLRWMCSKLQHRTVQHRTGLFKLTLSLTLITFAFVSLTEDLYSYDFFETPNVPAPAVESSEIQEQEV